MSTIKSNRLPIGTVVLAIFFLLAMLATYLLVKRPAPPAELQGVISPQFRLLNDFDLTSSSDKAITQANLSGKWSFIFFGYTSCPDVCPTTLHVLSQVRQLVKDDRRQYTDDVQVIFVSVDPQRDTPEKLSRYVGFFDKSFTGATGSETNLAEFSRQFGAGFVIEPGTTTDSYNVAHTSAIFLVDPQLRHVATFSQPHYAQTIHKQYNKIRDYFSGVA